MSKDFVEDIEQMHDKFDFMDKVKNLSNEDLYELLKFRFKFLKEELDEGNKAVQERNPEEIVDALIDLIVVSIGTLDLFEVDSYEAWNKVLKANMSKEAGIKPERPNPLGLPDLMKPDGWESPSHEDNHGSLTRACK